MKNEKLIRQDFIVHSPLFIFDFLFSVLSALCVLCASVVRSSLRGREEDVKTVKKDAPHIVGSGFVSLDVVVPEGDGDRVRLFAGGTCGNVLAALSLLGWESYPVAHLGDGPAAHYVRADLRSCGVRGDFLVAGPHGSTPVVVQQFVRDREGRRTHRFGPRRPRCSRLLAPYRSVSGAEGLRWPTLASR